MSNLFLWISKNNFLDKSYKILYPWMVAGVGAGNIGTTTGCAACGLACLWHPGRVRPDYNQPTKVSRQVTCCLVKLQVHDCLPVGFNAFTSIVKLDPRSIGRGTCHYSCHNGSGLKGEDEASDYTILVYQPLNLTSYII